MGENESGPRSIVEVDPMADAWESRFVEVFFLETLAKRFVKVVDRGEGASE